MVSQTLLIRARRHHLFPMFCLRGLFCAAKDFCFLVVLLCAIFILVTSKPSAVNEVQSRLEFDRCKRYRGNLDTNSLDVFDGHVSSELVSRHSVQQYRLESICPHSNAFCFPSTVTGFLLNEDGAESEASDASGLQSEGVCSSGLTQSRSNLSRSPEHGIFRLSGGRVLSCSSYQRDDSHKFASTDVSAKNGRETDVPSCISTLFDRSSHSSKSGENAETVKSDFLDGLTTPMVEIRPSLLDWGQKNMYYPSLAFLTVKNVDTDSVLRIYAPYSSNSQFYPCNFSDIVLAPGEVASICFVFLPTNLGLSFAQLVFQTSIGGFLIPAKGFAVGSPYLIKPISDLDVSSSGRWRKNLSLFNPFDEALYVEEVTAWISISSENTSRSLKAICGNHRMEDSSQYNILQAKEWLDLENSEGGLPKIAVRPHKNWELGPQNTETVIEFDVSDTFSGKIVGAFCLKLMRSSENKTETVMVPLEVELNPSPDSDSDCVSVSLEALVPCETSGPVIVALSINDTRRPEIEMPCIDVISVCPGRLDSTVGYTQGTDNLDYMNDEERSFSSSMQPPYGVKAVDTREADEFVLKNWKSQGTASFMSVLDDNEVLYPMVQVGNHSSEWVAVKNPSQEPILVQLILNSGEVIDKCRTPEMHLQPSSSRILAGNKSIAPTRYGFSIAKDALTEALIYPFGSASFGPILFQPSNRCEWRSSVLIRNNLSGLEWLSLRGFGGSLSLVLLEGSDPVQSLEFKLKLPSLLNFPSPETLHSMEGKIPSCCHPLIKKVYAKNMGDFPLEVVRIEVSGSECGLDGFLVHDCNGFSLLPGESIMLQISYQSDFFSATIQRDLELMLATGILVIPMRASLPMYLLDFCKRSVFWMRVKKALVSILFAVSLLFFLAFLLLPAVTASMLPSFGSRKNSFILSGASNSWIMHHKEKSGAIMPNMDGFGASIVGEKALLLASVGNRPDGHAPDQVLTNSSGHRKQPPETRLASPVLSNPSPLEKSDAQDASDSRDLRVRIGKEKGRRRRKKKNPGMAVPGLFEVSSSQSGNSTPSSPLSPAAFITPKPQLSPNTDHSTDVRIPFSPDDKQECSRSFKNWCFSDQEKSSATVTRKLAGRAVLLPSATFPSAGTATPPQTCRSPFLASTSTIAPHARAPGTKLHHRKADDELGEKMSTEEKFTYDIWGNHLFALPLTHQSKQSGSMSPGALKIDSGSFFVRDPQTLIKSSLSKPVSFNSGVIND
ncbi:hypothetical protein Salat_1404100 [Sesamum alatum]|uniref:Transmembrane protein 131-like N-terminal domain-containing protein n=1 Tax=Sesamum alatum TaxID=300844 RepID=A0AAE1Y9U8_9LAMI|nr:hypothetical protein Salat_1404100 [Sesamum alatum]